MQLIQKNKTAVVIGVVVVTLICIIVVLFVLLINNNDTQRDEQTTQTGQERIESVNSVVEYAQICNSLSYIFDGENITYADVIQRMDKELREIKAIIPPQELTGYHALNIQHIEAIKKVLQAQDQNQQVQTLDFEADLLVVSNTFIEKKNEILTDVSNATINILKYYGCDVQQKATNFAGDAKRIDDIGTAELAIEVYRLRNKSHKYPASTSKCVPASTLTGLDIDMSFAEDYYYQVNDTANPTKYRLIAHLNDTGHTELGNDLDSNVDPDITMGTRCDCSQLGAYCVGT